MVLQRATSGSKKISKSTKIKNRGKKRLHLWYYKGPRVEAGLRRVVFDTRRGEPFEFVPFLFFFTPRRLALFFESY